MPVKSGWREPRAYPQGGGKRSQKKAERVAGEQKPTQNKGTPPERNNRKERKKEGHDKKGRRNETGKKGREERRDKQKKQTHTHTHTHAQKKKKERWEPATRDKTHKAEQRKGRASSIRPAKVEAMWRQKKPLNVMKWGKAMQKGTNRKKKKHE